MTPPQPPSRTRDFREWAQIVVVVSTAILGVYTFVFRDILKPAARPTALDVTASLEHVGRKAEHELIRLRIVSRNPTDRRVYIPALWYTVLGEHLAAHDRAQFPSNVRAAPVRTLTALDVGVDLVDVVAVGRVLTEYSNWYDPLDKTADEYLFAIPAQKYDFLEARVLYIQVKDTVGLASTNWSQLADGQWSAQLALLRPGSDSTDLFDPEKIQRQRSWEKKSGASENWTVVTLPLWPVPAKASSPGAPPD